MSTHAVLSAARAIQHRADMKPGTTAADQAIQEAKAALKDGDVSLALAKVTLGAIAEHQWGQS